MLELSRDFCRSVTLFFLTCDSFPHVDEEETPPHPTSGLSQAVPEGALLLPLAHSQSLFPRLPTPLQCIPWKQTHQENTLWLSLLFEACVWNSAFVPNEHVDSFRNAVSVFESAELFMLIVSIKLLF